VALMYIESTYSFDMSKNMPKIDMRVVYVDYVYMSQLYVEIFMVNRHEAVRLVNNLLRLPACLLLRI